jgi:hypothetical protein
MTQEDLQGLDRMSGKYVPLHLRGKPMRPASPPKRGVKWPSNTTGNNTRNVSYKKAPTHFANNAEESRSTKYAKLSRRLGTRKLRTKPVKSALKKGKQTLRRKTL